MIYLNARDVKQKYSITSQTLYNWRKKGKITFKRFPSGRIMYLPIEEIGLVRKNVLYARVSNTKQKEDLIRQESVLRNYMGTNGIICDDSYTDIASGMNENRSGFNKLITDCLSGKISKVFVTYKDRLTRFGFGYIEYILKQCGVSIVVINSTKEEDFQQELTQDLVSVIHHFSMKLYSNRRKELNRLAVEIDQDINK